MAREMQTPGFATTLGGEDEVGQFLCGLGMSQDSQVDRFVSVIIADRVQE
jgi:hypothetical protein